MNDVIIRLAKEYREADKKAMESNAAVVDAAADKVDELHNIACKAWEDRNAAANVLSLSVCSELGI